MGISKTSFMRGMQCRKMLWLDKHKRNLRIIPPETQVIMDAGNEFGDRAMGMFGEFEEMTVYKPNTHYPDTVAMVKKTQNALHRGVRVICEAAFSYKYNYCAVDILLKTENGYDIYEVKNVPDVEDQFILDAAFQNYILSRCGLKVDRIWIVTHGPDVENPFLPVEITEDAKEYYKWVENNITDLDSMQNEPEEIMVMMGEHCLEPYECWYYEYCKKLNDKGDMSDLDDEYPAHSRIANSKSSQNQEGYPVIKKPMYSAAHEDPDESEYCTSSGNETIGDDYDSASRQINDTDDYGIYKKKKYPDGYDS